MQIYKSYNVLVNIYLALGSLNHLLNTISLSIYLSAFNTRSFSDFEEKKGLAFINGMDNRL